jgi:hypothetical protein
MLERVYSLGASMNEHAEQYIVTDVIDIKTREWRSLFAREYLLPPPDDPMRGAAESMERFLQSLGEDRG